ncbi:shikimate dehydrogenase [Salinithrix halophila]|uniref:Shikimate dehydrogenase (NADP(+)) n=1 Tax=Salinithrix halophila TaxID=1485204 RepID=A0ABV8JG16_9BACL
MTITSRTEKIGLIGHPVGHSKSPEIMNDAFQEQKLPFAYLAFDVAPENLRDAVGGLKALGFKGWNVTIPHKVAIMDLLDELEESAREIGAVNMVINRDGIMIGTNTDGEGYIQSLRQDIQLDPRGARVVLLGAGGAARAVGHALAAAGASRITVVNRTEAKGQKLASHLNRLTEADWTTMDRLQEPLSTATLLVQTTSVGMVPREEDCPIDPALLHRDLVVSDLIYHPRQTRLLREAKIRGARIHSGLGMLVHQAALAYERWTGEKAPVERMYKTLSKALEK